VEHPEIVSLEGKFWRHGYTTGRESVNAENPLKASLEENRQIIISGTLLHPALLEIFEQRNI